MGTANKGITTRHAASLRPSKNGRIGFKPPHSKGETAAKTRMGSTLYRGALPLGEWVLIKAVQFFEDRSGAACRVVIRNLPWALPQRVTFLPVGEIGHCALGRGGAERSECPPTYEPTSARPPAPRRYNNRGVPWVAWYAHGDGATGGHLDRNDILAMPTVGAGSSRFSRRFPRPLSPTIRVYSPRIALSSPRFPLRLAYPANPACRLSMLTPRSL